MESRIHLKNNETLILDADTAKGIIDKNRRFIEFKKFDKNGEPTLIYGVPTENIWYIENLELTKNDSN